MLLACGKIGPALVTGNTIIVKPSYGASSFLPCTFVNSLPVQQTLHPLLQHQTRRTRPNFLSPWCDPGRQWR